MSIRVALADDHPIVSSGCSNCTPTLSSSHGVQTQTKRWPAVRHHRPDVLVLDLLMPGTSGVALWRALAHEDHPPKVVLLTAVADNDQRLLAMRLGAQGIVLKEMTPAFLVDAVRGVHTGGQWLDPGLGRTGSETAAHREARTHRDPVRLLSPRERELIRYLAQGLRNSVIADRMAITEGTVKAYLHNTYE